MRKLTTEEFIAKAQAVHGDRYDYSRSIYSGRHFDIEIVCPIHGVFLQDTGSHIKGSNCPQCMIDKSSLERRKSLEQFIIDANMVHGNFYNYDKVIYNNRLDKIEIVCPIHDSFWQKPGDHLINQQGCPKCKSSKGERIIRNYLVLNDITFAEQYTDPTCKDIARLKFDFYLPDYNMLIEYQGQQHYQFVRYIQKTINNFESQQKRDQIKRDWAKQNNIQLLEISYKELDIIDTVLSTLLS